MYEGEVGGNTADDYPNQDGREESKEDGGSGGTNQIEENKQKVIDKKLIFGGKGRP
jgi:hypothetical protein